jgi:thiosulfate dehydrogenase [quinone] large subunit
VDRNRRTLCQAGLALGCVAALPACGGSSNKSSDGGSDGGDSCDVGDVGVGNASDTPLNSATNVPVSNANGMSLFICHDADGYYAVDAGCTHLGCDVALKAMSDLAQGFLCPCHGATYDANGLHPTGLAPSPLLHYALCAEPSGALVCKVSPSAPVAPTVRLKV